MTKEECIEETTRHVDTVQKNIRKMEELLADRADLHDASKLCEQELPLFQELTPKLKSLTYGSPEYKEALKQLKPALDHHYECNRHHPEHFGSSGIKNLKPSTVEKLKEKLGRVLDEFGLKGAVEVDIIPAVMQGGINEMNLIDLMEMICDWAAATKRHEDGCLMDSLVANRDRFGISPQLSRILKNTVGLLPEKKICGEDA